MEGASENVSYRRLGPFRNLTVTPKNHRSGSILHVYVVLSSPLRGGYPHEAFAELREYLLTPCLEWNEITSKWLDG